MKILTAIREELCHILRPPFTKPLGDVWFDPSFNHKEVSYYYSRRLEEQIRLFPGWKRAGPIVLGSWARQELCPNSDLDLLFCGEEEFILPLTSGLQQAGFKVRFRVPEDRQDWTVGVEAFDVLALLKARALTSEAAEQLHRVQREIWKRRPHYRGLLLKAVLKERASRREKFGSLVQLLEPNIKYSPGGLRDMEQAFQVMDLFSEKLTQTGHALQILNYYKSFFLTVRQRLHLDYETDILVGGFQEELAEWLGYTSHKDFMRELQKGFSRCFFYSSWILEMANSSEREIKRIQSLDVSTGERILSNLQNNQGILLQKRVRESLRTVKLSRKQSGRILRRILASSSSVAMLDAVFSSRLIDVLVDSLGPLVGYVQHDQYHKYTTDIHILRAVRFVQVIKGKPALLWDLKKILGSFRGQDWEVLMWSALYHDLGKGKELADHDKFSEKIWIKDSQEFGLPQNLRSEVAWLVLHHLDLSKAAFKANPWSSETWAELMKIGVTSVRLRRLAVFTAIDIMATNEQAWNKWKSQQLMSLVSAIESAEGKSFQEFFRAVYLKKSKIPQEILSGLDFFLLKEVPAKTLAQDLVLVQNSIEDFDLRLIKKDRTTAWVRIYERPDRPGLLAKYLFWLYQAGVSVQHAAVQSFASIGVYNWFQVGHSMGIERLRRKMEIMHSNEIPPLPPKIQFDSVNATALDKGLWLLRIEGLDQPGFLFCAAKKMADRGLSIVNAQVHTWGANVQDQFTVSGSRDQVQEFCEEITLQTQRANSIIFP